MSIQASLQLMKCTILCFLCFFHSVQPSDVPDTLTAFTRNGYDTPLGTDAVCWRSKAAAFFPVNDMAIMDDEDMMVEHEDMMVEHENMMVEHENMMVEHGNMMVEHDKLVEHHNTMVEHDHMMVEHGNMMVEHDNMTIKNPLVDTFILAQQTELLQEGCGPGNTIYVYPPIEAQSGEILRTNQMYEFSVNVSLSLSDSPGLGQLRDPREDVVTSSGRRVVALHILQCQASRTGFCSPFVHAQNFRHTDIHGSVHDAGAHIHSDWTFLELNPNENGLNRTVILTSSVDEPGDYFVIASLQFYTGTNDTLLSYRWDMANGIDPELIGTRVLWYQTPPRILEVSKGVRFFCYSLIAVVSSVISFLIYQTIKHRKESVLNLSQADFLVVFLVAALTATVSAFLLEPKNDVYCQASSPLIFIPIHLMYSIILGRLWRINAVVSPLLVQHFRRSIQSNKAFRRFFDIYRRISLGGLGICGCCVQSNSAKLRRHVSGKRLAVVVAFFALPQVIIQVFSSVLQPQYLSIDWNANESVGRPRCRNNEGIFTSIINYGYVSMVMVILTLLFMARNSRKLPSLFNETSVIYGVTFESLMLIVLGAIILVVTGTEDTSPDIEYLVWVAVILSITLGSSFRLMYPKLKMVWDGETVIVSKLVSDHHHKQRQRSNPSCNYNLDPLMHNVTGLNMTEVSLPGGDSLDASFPDLDSDESSDSNSDAQDTDNPNQLISKAKTDALNEKRFPTEDTVDNTASLDGPETDVENDTQIQNKISAAPPPLIPDTEAGGESSESNDDPVAPVAKNRSRMSTLGGWRRKNRRAPSMAITSKRPTLLTQNFRSERGVEPALNKRSERALKADSKKRSSRILTNEGKKRSSRLLKGVVISPDEAPPRRLILKMVDLQESLRAVNDKVMSGLSVKTEQWDKVNSLITNLEKILREDVQFSWRENRPRLSRLSIDLSKSSLTGNLPTISDGNGPLIDGADTEMTNVRNKSIRRQSVLERRKTLSQVAHDFRKCVDVRNRKWGPIVYHQVFVGSDAVDSVLYAGLVKSREEAVDLGKKLAKELQLIQHVTGEFDFEDKKLFYNFVDDFDDSSNVSDDSDDESSLGSLDDINESVIDDVQAFRDAVGVKDRVYRMKTYRNVFVGSEAVDALVYRGVASTRWEAVQLGRKLAREHNLFVHVANEWDFQDDFKFYKYCAPNTKNINLSDSLSLGAILTSPQQKTKSTLAEMADAFKMYVDIRDRRYRFNVYKQCFVGSEAVDALMYAGLAKSREGAVEIGKKLEQELRLFRHFTGDHAFEDKYYFYRLRNQHEEGVENNTLGSLSKNELKIDSQSTLGDVNVRLAHLEEKAVAFKKVVMVKDRTYRLKKYPDVFVGNEAIDALVTYGFAQTRREAVQLGRELAREFKMFEHVSGDHAFSDDFLFYRYIDLADSGHDSYVGRSLSMLEGGNSFSEGEAGTAPKPTLGLSTLAKQGKAFKKCVDVRDRKHRMNSYKSCFIGAEAVDAVIFAKLAKTREEAVFLGRKLASELRLFKNIGGDHEFKDDYLFYRFRDDEDGVYSNESEEISASFLVESSGLSKVHEKAVHFKRCVLVGDRKYRARTYKEVFVGSEAIDAIVEEGLAATRNDAVQLGRVLARDLGLFSSVTGNYAFNDDFLLFRYNDHYEEIAGDLNKSYRPSEELWSSLPSGRLSALVESDDEVGRISATGDEVGTDIKKLADGRKNSGMGTDTHQEVSEVASQSQIENTRLEAAVDSNGRHQTIEHGNVEVGGTEALGDETSDYFGDTVEA